MVCDFWPLKDKMYRVQATIGGDRLQYNKDTTSPTTNLLEQNFYWTALSLMLIEEPDV